MSVFPFVSGIAKLRSNCAYVGGAYGVSISKISFVKYLFIEDSVLPLESLLAVVLNAICEFLVSGLFLISHASEGGNSAKS